MVKNASFVLIAAFWVCMNAMLWHSEIGKDTDLAASVPVDVVWEKILTAPDDSNLGIIQQGKKLGYLRWRPNAGEEGTAGKITSENEPEGIVRQLNQYTLELEGNLLLEIVKRPVRIEGKVVFDADRKFREFEALASMRPMSWKLKGSAIERDFWIQSRDGDDEWIRRFTVDDLRDPSRLLSEANLPNLMPLLGQLGMGGTGKSAPASPLALGITWTARYDWLSFGSSKVRIFRLQTRLLDRYDIVVLVTRVGEIIRVELPTDLRLVNEALFASS